MLRANAPGAKPDIQRAVDSILCEDSTYDRNDNRSAHRENLVRGVIIEMRDSKFVMQGFSRNVSGSGMGIITSQPVCENAFAVLSIASLAGEDTRILAECRWCKSYGKGWCLSGWQFVSMIRG